MGKTTGFMEFEKKERDYVDISERIQSYKEFVLPLSEEETKTQAAICMKNGKRLWKISIQQIIFPNSQEEFVQPLAKHHAH